MTTLSVTQLVALEIADQDTTHTLTKPYITTRLLIEKDDHYLYLHQTEARGGRLSLPGGKVKYKEFARKGLIREVLEETNLTIDKKNLQHIHTIHRKENGEFEVIFFFKATLDNVDDLALNEPHKFQGFVWVSKESIPDNLVGACRFALKKLNKNRIFSEYPKKKKAVLDIDVDTDSHQNTPLSIFQYI